MTDRELKRLSRSELLEMLIAQMEENEKLKIDLETVQEKANNRRIAIDRAGSIAEAALVLNGVFDAAEAAASQYLENIRKLSDEKEAACQRMEEDARAKAKDVCAEADAYSKKVRTEAEEYSRRARTEADLYQKRVEEKNAAFFREKDNLDSLLHPDKEGGTA